MLGRAVSRMVATRRILVTGAGGQIGQDLVIFLQNKYGVQNVLATDIADREVKWEAFTRQEKLDVLDFASLDATVARFKPHRIYHLASMLSARSEETPLRALQVNVAGTHNILEVSRKHQVSLYSASSIAAYGPSSPKIVSDMEIMRPNTIYGITKIHLELLGEYYYRRYKLDFRSSRIPIVNSWDDVKDGTATFTVSMFYDLFRTGKTVVPVREDVKMPIMYIPDLIRSLDDIMEAPSQRFTARVYTLESCSISVGDYIKEVKQYFPTGEIIVSPDSRDAVMRTWPQGTKATLSSRDWGHKLQYGLKDIVQDMYTRIKNRLRQ